MKSLRFSLNLLAVASLGLVFSTLANAQATRTWVSGVGDDANPCSRTAPCKTFAGAISKTAAGGEIDCLDPGGFGQVTITKSITLDCNAGVGSILGSSGSSINIVDPTPSTPTIVVTIRNLSLIGVSPATNGINVSSAKQVNLKSLVIQQFTNAGVNVATSASVSIAMSDVFISNNAIGIQASTSAGNAVIDGSGLRVVNNAVGVKGLTFSLMTFRDCNISLASAQGVVQTAGGSQINLVHSVLSSNATAVQSVGGSTIRIVGNAFVQNGTALNTNGGTIASDLTNVNAGNGVVGAASSLPAPITM
jgi:hypothetical protein